MLGFFRSHSSSSFSLSHLSLSSHQTTPASSLHLLAFLFVEPFLSLPLWSYTGSSPFAFPTRFAKKFVFFGPFWGSCTSRILFLLGQWGPIFLKLRLNSCFLGVIDLGWRNVAGGGGVVFLITISSSFKGGGVNFFNLIRFLCILLPRIPLIGTNLTWLRNLIGFWWAFGES